MSEGMHSVHVTVNGMQRDVGVPPGMSLLELLREELDLKGTKLNCEQGECGACTVLLDGRPVDSCLVLAVSVPGSRFKRSRAFMTAETRFSVRSSKPMPPNAGIARPA